MQRPTCMASLRDLVHLQEPNGFSTKQHATCMPQSSFLPCVTRDHASQHHSITGTGAACMPIQEC